MMFSSIVVSGIQLITREKMTARDITIVSVALGLGYGFGSNSGVLAGLPPVRSADFRRIRNRTGSSGSYGIKYCASKGRSIGSL